MEKTGIIRFVEESDLMALEWNGEYSRYRNMYREIYCQSLTGNTLLWVLEIDKIGIIGQIFAQINSGNKKFADGKQRAYLFSFRVKNQFQNQGWGTQLLDNTEYYFTKRGFLYTTLNVSKDNQNALRFYLNRGYKIVGEEKGVWSYVDPEGNNQIVNDPSWRMEKMLFMQKMTLANEDKLC